MWTLFKICVIGLMMIATIIGWVEFHRWIFTVTQQELVSGLVAAVFAQVTWAVLITLLIWLDRKIG